MNDMMNGQNYPVQPQVNPVQPQDNPVQPSTTPELEQILVKIQEVDSRLGDVEMKIAELSGGVNADTYSAEEQLDEEDEEEEDKKKTIAEKYKALKRKFESFKKRLKEQGELTGVPEIDKDKKKVSGDQSANMEVPQAQTSTVNDNGSKTGAPVAGEETEDKHSKDAEEEGISEVPKPTTEFPKQAIIKNALDSTIGKVTDGGAEDPTTTDEAGKEAPENPEVMEDEEGKKVPKEGSLEEQYARLKREIKKEDLSKHKSQVAFRERMKKFSERQSVVGSSGINTRVDSRAETDKSIKEYLIKSKVRIT